MEFRMLQAKDLNEKQVEIIEDLGLCQLCGTALVFRHETDYLKLKVTEHSHCPCCHVRLQDKEFTLQ